MVAALALAAAAGCAGPGSETKTAPVGLSPGLARLRVRVRRDPAPLDQEVGAALETELARAGMSISTDDRTPSDAEVKVSLDLRSVGPVVEGIATASIAQGGTLIDRMSTALDVYRRDHFAALVGRQLAEAIAKSPRVAALSGSPAPAPGPPVEAPPPAPVAQPPRPAAAPAPAVIPAGTEPLGRSGGFGWGFGLEAQLGYAQVFAPGASPAGVHLALGVQVDMGPQAAFRLPLAFEGGGSGDQNFGELSFVPTYIYRFRNHADQTFVPYLGLGLKLLFVDASRRVLGRPDIGVKTPDSCGRHNSSTIRDCSFGISPEPTAGVEWHANRLFALDVAASYSFAHLTSSAGLVSWIQVVTVFVGPRLSF